MKKKVMNVVTLGTDAIMRYGMDLLPASVRVSTRVYLQCGQTLALADERHQGSCRAKLQSTVVRHHRRMLTSVSTSCWEFNGTLA